MLCGLPLDHPLICSSCSMIIEVIIIAKNVGISSSSSSSSTSSSTSTSAKPEL